MYSPEVALSIILRHIQSQMGGFELMISGVDTSALEGNIRQFNRRYVEHPVTVPIASTLIPTRGVSSRHDFKSGTRIVDLQASGFGFTARDSEGAIWVWGKSDVQSPLSDNLSLRLQIWWTTSLLTLRLTSFQGS